MQQTGIFAGRTEVRCPYARWGWTRGGGKVWHGGLDLAGLDDATIRMPYYKGKRITGRVTRARIVTDRRDKIWEWGYYVCVQLDRGQTPDAVNFLYFAHCASLLVKAGQRVASGDALAVMGNTGNAALAARVGEGYDVVLANIVADVIIGMRTELCRFLRPGGILIASGIIGERADEVAAALTDCGLVIEVRGEQEDWVVLRCSKPL